MNKLVYDRNQYDVSNKTWKGYYNASDLNRVEEWCRYLADELNAVGYDISITTKTDWTSEDLRTNSDMLRIRNNIMALMNGFHSISTMYTSVDSWGTIKANRWEKILQEIYDMMYGMKNYYVYSGVSRVGQPRIWQYRFRKFFDVPTITAVPNFRVLNYIEATGTQYIQTSIPIVTGMKVKMVVEPKEISTGCFFGSNYNPLPYHIGITDTSGVFYFYYTINSSRHNFTAFYPEINKKYCIEAFLGETSQYITINDQTEYSSFNLGALTGSNAIVFGRNSTSDKRLCKARIYNLEIYKDDVLVAQLIPALDSSNVPCFYDTVSNTFLYNAGTGTFLYG